PSTNTITTASPLQENDRLLDIGSPYLFQPNHIMIYQTLTLHYQAPPHTRATQACRSLIDTPHEAAGIWLK
ncbi:MAG: hypothetical protein AAB721_00985, partial [Patescibacteria group bacterium]